MFIEKMRGPPEDGGAKASRPDDKLKGVSRDQRTQYAARQVDGKSFSFHQHPHAGHGGDARDGTRDEKSHGRARAPMVHGAIRTAQLMKDHDVVAAIKAELSAIHARNQAAEPAASPGA